MEAAQSIDSLAEAVESVIFAQAKSTQEILGEGNTTEKTIELAGNASCFVQLNLDHVGDDQVVCRKGCNFCCHLLVEVSAPEALTIAEYVRDQFTEAEQADLMKAIDAHIEATGSMDHKKRFNSRVQCPLLRDGLCSVYTVRPLACRTWHSFSVEKCQEDFEHPTDHTTAPVNVLALALSGNIRNGLAIALRAARLEYRSLELVRALKIALENPSLMTEWRENPKAFEGAVTDRVHPDRAKEAQYSRIFDKAYRYITNRPDWKI
jgi:Fe-S-cluster containining protein